LEEEFRQAEEEGEVSSEEEEEEKEDALDWISLINSVDY